MPRRSSKDEDEVQAAFRIVARVTGQEPDAELKPAKRKKNPAAVALGRLGGKKGGVARAKALTPAQRSEIAKKAAAKRWGTSAE